MFIASLELFPFESRKFSYVIARENNQDLE